MTIYDNISDFEVTKQFLEGTLSEYYDDDLPRVAPYVFMSCYSLTYFSGENVSSIGSYAFQACSNLSSIYIPNCKYIGYSAFAYVGLKEFPTLPKLETINSSAFILRGNISANTVLTLDLPKLKEIQACPFAVDCETSRHITLSITFGNDPSAAGFMFNYYS